MANSQVAAPTLTVGSLDRMIRTATDVILIDHKRPGWKLVASAGSYQEGDSKPLVVCVDSTDGAAVDQLLKRVAVVRRDAGDAR
jgi:hypothetical protein